MHKQKRTWLDHLRMHCYLGGMSAGCFAGAALALEEWTNAILALLLVGVFVVQFSIYRCLKYERLSITIEAPVASASDPRKCACKTCTAMQQIKNKL